MKTSKQQVLWIKFFFFNFTQHILRPLKICQELKSRSSSIPDDSRDVTSTSWSPTPSLSRDSSCSSLSIAAPSEASSGFQSCLASQQHKWNFRTLAEINIEYSERTLFLDTTSGGPMDLFNENDNRQLNNNNPRSISVLFDETFYTVDKQKYKVLCISSPLNSQVESENFCNTAGTNPGMWNLSSLRDCIDFLWINARARTLETFDAYIRLFLHNHRSLADLPGQ